MLDFICTLILKYLVNMLINIPQLLVGLKSTQGRAIRRRKIFEGYRLPFIMQGKRNTLLLYRVTKNDSMDPYI